MFSRVAPPLPGKNLREVVTVKRKEARIGIPHALVAAVLLLAATRPYPAVSADKAGPPPMPTPVAGGTAGAVPAGPGPSGARIVREGIAVEFSYGPPEKKEAAGKVLEGEFVDLRFRVTDEASGKPVRSLRPGAWMDIDRPFEGKGGQPPLDCRKKVSLFLQGIVGIRPMLDLNGYFVLVLNREPEIYVIDPFVGMSGRTNLYATIRLREPGTDWVKSADEKRVYVTMSKAGKVAVIDTETFKLETEADAGENPVRIAVQPDGQRLWVGNDAGDGKPGAVTAIDTATLKKAASVPVGRGHHEMAFSPDSRFVYVTNRADGTVSVIDAREGRKVADVPTGPLPISLDYSAQAQALYVADGREGVVSVVDGRSHEVKAKVRAKPGLGPMRFTPDGRWGLVLNSREDAVHVIDASTNRVAHTVAVGKEPYQLVLTRAFAHVRCLGTERVYMVNLQQLGKETPPPVNSYAAGAEPPGKAPDLGVARGISNAVGEAEVLVVSPAERTISFYMEGMNAPMGSFRGYGKNPRGVETANRSLKETDPGVYTGRVRVPVAGVYDVAFFLDTPPLVHCFEATAEPNPALQKPGTAYELEFLVRDRDAPVGDNVTVRFRLDDARTGSGKEGLKDASVLYYLSPGRYRTEVRAREVGGGVYEATLLLREPGAYSVHVGVPSLRIGYDDFTQLSLVGRRKETAPAGSDPGGKGPKESK